VFEKLKTKQTKKQQPPKKQQQLTIPMDTHTCYYCWFSVGSGTNAAQGKTHMLA